MSSQVRIENYKKNNGTFHVFELVRVSFDIREQEQIFENSDSVEKIEIGNILPKNFVLVEKPKGSEFDSSSNKLVVPVEKGYGEIFARFSITIMPMEVTEIVEYKPNILIDPLRQIEYPLPDPKPNNKFKIIEKESPGTGLSFRLVPSKDVLYARENEFEITIEINNNSGRQIDYVVFKSLENIISEGIIIIPVSDNVIITDQNMPDVSMKSHIIYMSPIPSGHPTKRLKFVCRFIEKLKKDVISLSFLPYVSINGEVVALKEKTLEKTIKTTKLSLVLSLDIDKKEGNVNEPFLLKLNCRIPFDTAKFSIENIFPFDSIKNFKVTSNKIVTMSYQKSERNLLSLSFNSNEKITEITFYLKITPSKGGSFTINPKLVIKDSPDEITTNALSSVTYQVRPLSPKIQVETLEKSVNKKILSLTVAITNEGNCSIKNLRVKPINTPGLSLLSIETKSEKNTRNASDMTWLVSSEPLSRSQTINAKLKFKIIDVSKSLKKEQQGTILFIGDAPQDGLKEVKELFSFKYSLPGGFLRIFKF